MCSYWKADCNRAFLTYDVALLCYKEIITPDLGDQQLFTKNIRVILIFLILTILVAGIGAEEISYARYPALSPDGQTIAFTYRGDIWTVPSTGGTAVRLTVHEAEDITPYFSPDGKWIAFSSDRYNNMDVFVIPVSGGPARQITYNSEFDYISGWFAGGDSLIFSSGRSGYQDIYKISAEGGQPIKLTGYFYESEYFGRITPDGKYMLYNNGSGMSRWWRRDLKTSRNADIFIQDRTVDTFTSRRLTDYPNHDTWPIYNQEQNEVYFVSCRDDWAQIYKIPFDGGETVALTSFIGDGVQWLNANPQGTKLVFEQGFKIWTLDPQGDQLQQVSIEINTDERENMLVKKTFSNKVEYFSLSPDDKKVAAVIHGEIFVLPAEEAEETRRMTDTPARESFPVWAPDSKTVYYSSDRNGNGDIFCVDAFNCEEKQITSDERNEIKPLVSPDGKYLVFYRGLDEIVRYEIATGEETLWVEGVFFDLGVEPTAEYGWSPDSRWLAFTMAGPTYETNIYVVPLDGEPQNISRLADYNFRPRFSADGKKLYFSSYFPEYAQTYEIDLTYQPAEFAEASYDSLFMEEPEKDEKDKDKDKETKKDDETEVSIDFHRIIDRRHPAFRLDANNDFPVLTPDGEKYLFVSPLLGKPEIWSVNTKDDPDLKQLTHSGKDIKYLQVTSDSKKVYFLESGKIKYTEISDGKGETLSLAATLDIDILKLNRQKFNETWQILNTYFYDSDFHGTNWNMVKTKYEPLIEEVRTETDFRNILKEMMGELRASHLYPYSLLPGPDDNARTGLLGLEFDQRTLDREGQYLVSRVVTASPADLAGIKTGQYILAVDGIDLDRQTNISQILAGKVGARVILTVADKPGKKGSEVAVKPIDNIREMEYNDLVEERRRLVDSLSNGRLAYVHIMAMSGPYLEKFKEEIVSRVETKEGVIIDVRNNGGGNIAVHLLGIMVKTPYFLRNFRDFPATSENKMRSKAIEKPMSLLINNYSASNSEIFAAGFRRLELGKIIGEPTSGAVIGTASYYLMDGMRIRRPSWGAFTFDMEDTDLAPRQPDILVENLPDDFINNRDPQLVRAVEEMLNELE